MKLSNRGAKLIAHFEGFVAHSYNDAAGHATIGFGHLLHRGPVTAADKSRWGTISRDRGLALLIADAREAEHAVANAVHVSLTQEQFDALVSFVFNVGAGAFRSSTLLRKLNAGEKRGAADEAAALGARRQPGPGGSAAPAQGGAGAVPVGRQGPARRLHGDRAAPDPGVRPAPRRLTAARRPAARVQRAAPADLARRARVRVESHPARALRDAAPAFSLTDLTAIRS